MKNNPDQIEAINIISGRPKDLTRSDLKALLLALKQKGFTPEQLNGAISRMTNRDMGADIIGIIRSYALGVPLVGKEERIRSASGKLKKAHNFNKAQQNWINRFEKALMNEPILNLKTIDEIPMFREKGGSVRLDRLFDNRLADIIDELNIYLYESEGAAA